MYIKHNPWVCMLQVRKWRHSKMAYTKVEWAEKPSNLKICWGSKIKPHDYVTQHTEAKIK